MKIRISPLKTLIAALAIVVAVPTMAYAVNPFTDVPSEKFYAEAVDWAYNNGVTTGTSATTFSPEANVTRGENITFAWRYDDLIVQPALDDRYTKAEVDAAIAAAVDAAIASAAPEVYHAVVGLGGTIEPGNTPGVVPLNTATGLYEVVFPTADIRACVFHATLVNETATGPPGLKSGPVPPVGQISLADDWDPSFLGEGSDADSIEVATADSAGTPTDYPFHLTVYC
jgi:hypothetical protein